jgi:hypothetical protein
MVMIGMILLTVILIFTVNGKEILIPAMMTLVGAIDASIIRSMIDSKDLIRKEDKRA